jgi:hypothetical protein
MLAIAQYYKMHTQRQREASIDDDECHALQQDDSFLGSAALDALTAGCDVVLCCQSIEKEFSVIECVSNKIKADSHFKNMILQKAWNVYSTSFL